ncbi:hypothetical protein OROHE_002137 [Orobanche hederae]
MGVMENNPTALYVDWKEVVVSTDKGRREVHYYLKRGGGGSGSGGDLVIVGKEKSAGHMSYRYTTKNNKLLPSILNHSSTLKLRSRKEVIDWLSSILSVNSRSISKRRLRDSQFLFPILDEHPNSSRRLPGGGMCSRLDDSVKDGLMRKGVKRGAQFMWLGSSWICHQRRRHYQSFCRNGAVISAQDFVYVMVEENKRLVAYLDDMYEDTRGNKMVVVRWFHKIDEVDLSIECIDGLATVLSPEHYDKCIHDATHLGLMPFVCYRQFDSDEVRPFDVTRMKGYWKQGVLRSNMTTLVDGVEYRPSKRVRWSKECGSHLKSHDKKETMEIKGDVKTGGLKRGRSCVSLSRQDNAAQAEIGEFMTVGSEVEVLSQDSGIRGCWFRASIIKKHKDKVKVQYKDVKDAFDDSKNVEEWVFAYRLAKSDALGIRSSGRTIVRPTSPFDKGRFSGVVNVGCVVDAWWHDGWWEGIVMKKESEDCLYVYFPEEKREVEFSVGYLRRSMEWLDNNWHDIKERPDLVSRFSSMNKTHDRNNTQPDKRIASPQNVIKTDDSSSDVNHKKANEHPPISDLSNDNLLSRLCWKSSGKRRRSRSPVNKAQSGDRYVDTAVKAGFQSWEKFFVNSSLKFDSDNCKYVGDSHFGSSVASPLTNLVMTR